MQNIKRVVDSNVSENNTDTWKSLYDPDNKIQFYPTVNSIEYRIQRTDGKLVINWSTLGGRYYDCNYLDLFSIPSVCHKMKEWKHYPIYEHDFKVLDLMFPPPQYIIQFRCMYQALL